MKARFFTLAFLFLLAFSLRVAFISHSGTLTGDESMHVDNAYSYGEHGYLGPDKWYHPPLKHLLTYGSIKAFGDEAFGRRIRNVVTGAGSVVALFLIAEGFGLPILPAIFCGLLLCFDPLHMAFSRTTFEDIPAVFFLLLGMHLCLVWLRSRRQLPLIAAGIAFGLAVSLRTYSATLILPIVAGLCGEAIFKKRYDQLPLLFSCFVIVPVTLFLTTYLPWFGRGYDLSEWMQLQRYALIEMAGLKETLFNDVIMHLARPATWFISVVGLGLRRGEGTIMVIMNNLPVWILMIPSLLFMLYQAARTKTSLTAAPPVLFATLFVPYLLATRPLFLYSSLPLLPMGFLAIAWAVHLLLPRHTLHVMVAVVVWGIFLYPLTLGISPPLQLYRPLLDHMNIIGPR